MFEAAVEFDDQALPCVVLSKHRRGEDKYFHYILLSLKRMVYTMENRDLMNGWEQLATGQQATIDLEINQTPVASSMVQVAVAWVTVS